MQIKYIENIDKIIENTFSVSDRLLNDDLISGKIFFILAELATKVVKAVFNVCSITADFIHYTNTPNLIFVCEDI